MLHLLTRACLPCPGPQWLRQKGLSGADKKAGRVATEGAVARYIHPGSRLGVLLEVNCETDFVAASEQFQSLVSELGMIVASTDVVCVSADDMPGDLLEKERQVRRRAAAVCIYLRSRVCVCSVCVRLCVCACVCTCYVRRM